MKSRGRHFLLLVLAAVLPAGCAGGVLLPNPPRVSLVDMAVTSVSLMETSYRITLRVMNPNDGALHVRGVDCEIDLNGEPFAAGVHAVDVNIPPFGTEVLQVPLYSSHVSLFRRVMGLQEKAELDYRLKGRLRLAGGATPSRTVPFSSEGKWTLKGPPAEK